MTTAQSWRRERARQTEALVAQWFAKHGWPNAEPVGPYQAGTDIRKMPGLYVSVKACAEARPRPWVRDADADARPDIAFVVHRPNNYGPATIATWPVWLSSFQLIRIDPARPGVGVLDGTVYRLPLAEVTELLHRAGYAG